MLGLERVKGHATILCLTLEPLPVLANTNKGGGGGGVSECEGIAQWSHTL